MTEIPELPQPDVKAGDYAGPAGEGASENLWGEESMLAFRAQGVRQGMGRAAEIAKGYAVRHAGDSDTTKAQAWMMLQCAAAIRTEAAKEKAPDPKAEGESGARPAQEEEISYAAIVSAAERFIAAATCAGCGTFGRSQCDPPPSRTPR